MPATPTIAVTDRSPGQRRHRGRPGSVGVDQLLQADPDRLRHDGEHGDGAAAGRAPQPLRDGTTLTFDPARRPDGRHDVHRQRHRRRRRRREPCCRTSRGRSRPVPPARSRCSPVRYPATASTNDSASVELGTAFSPTVDGTVTSIRFYKGAGNTGTHVGTVWSSTGQSAGPGDLRQRDQHGWQSVVAGPRRSRSSAGQTYVVSYLAPNGHYSSTANFFTSAWTAGHLTRRRPPATGGTSTVPAASRRTTWNSTNYFVDLGFVPAG